MASASPSNEKQLLRIGLSGEAALSGERDEGPQANLPGNI
jgi:hypothetical protein